MFAGIIQGVGTVQALRPNGVAARLAVAAPAILADAAPGASVAVQGVCLTVVGHEHGHTLFDVVRETLDATTLGRLQPGQGVNLERSLRLGDPIDGHVVQGHVDGVGRVLGVEREQGDWRLRIGVPANHQKYMVRKGSIAVDGVSLTIAATDSDGITVALIPETLARTTLAGLSPGDRVNLETDVLSRTIVDRIDALFAERGRPIEAVTS